MDFYNTVLPLCLAITIEVKSSKKFCFNVWEIAKRQPKFRGENWTFITNNWF